MKELVVDEFLKGVPREKIMKKFGITPTVYVSMISDAHNEKMNGLKEKAISMRKSGMMVKDIAKELGFARTTITRWTKDI